MPELPEVETTRLGITPHLLNRTIDRAIIHNGKLRWPIPRQLPAKVKRQLITSIQRRGKYLLLGMPNGTLILHLGMSGSLRVQACSTPAEKHDHFELVLNNSKCLRLRDPRRFGSVLWTSKDPLKHKLLRDLGPEPLSDEFYSEYLFNCARNRKVAIKQFIMNSKIVVGVGNIYASESLFMAGIHPKRAAGKISFSRYALLTQAIKDILTAAIQQGGTTLRDFVTSDGNPGYFKQQLKVYDRAKQPCLDCGHAIKHIQQGQRSTYYCPKCQK